MNPEHPWSPETTRLLSQIDAQSAGAGLDSVIDGLVRIAATTTGCPTVMVNRVDIDRQWVMTRHDQPRLPTQHILPFCAQAIRGSDLFEVPDAALDTRFHGNPPAAGKPGVRFYAGMPLNVGGRKIGTLCVVDHVPRRLDATQRTMFIDLARAVEHWFASRREGDRLRAAQETLGKSLSVIPGALFQYLKGPDARESVPYASEGLRTLCDLSPGHVRHDARTFFERIHPADRTAVRAAIDRSSRRLTPWRQQFRVETSVRGPRWIECNAMPEQMSDGSVLWHGHLHDVTAVREQERTRREREVAVRASVRTNAASPQTNRARDAPMAARESTQPMQFDAPTAGHLPVPAGLVRQAALQALVQVDELLHPSRLKQVLRPARVVVADVLASSLALIAPLAEQLGIRIVPTHYDAALIAYANEGALQHSLLSLLADGVKSSCERGRLRVDLHSADREVVICIATEGSSGQQMQRPLPSRLNDSLDEGSMPDHGLSLIVTTNLVEAMRGRLEIHEGPEGGRRFEVGLPTPEAAP